MQLVIKDQALGFVYTLYSWPAICDSVIKKSVISRLDICSLVIIGLNVSKLVVHKECIYAIAAFSISVSRLRFLYLTRSDILETL